jgi:uncharacterized membrane protein YoaK (UPF0700 family)
MKHAGSSVDLTPQKMSMLLAAVAGYVDSCTFLGLFGLFVAQVTGSFVVVGAQLITHDPGSLIKVLGIPFFLLGGALTTAVVVAVDARGGPAICYALGLEALFLGCFLIIGITMEPFKNPNGFAEITSAFLGLSAMGIQSAAVRLLMTGVASTNVMTTNTTLIAIEITKMTLAWRDLRREPSNTETITRFAAKRDQVAGLMLIVAGFLAGTIIGALAFQTTGFWSLLLPTVLLSTLSAWSAFTSSEATRPAQ